MVTPSANRIGARSRPMRYQPMSDINVTPFVDVMLVLLIIFMITAPLLTVGVPVDLPETSARQITNPAEPLVITINKTDKIFLQETAVSLDSLIPRLMAIAANKTDTRIFIRADKALAYGDVMRIMATITAAGFTKVALITSMPRGARGAPTGKAK